MPSRRIRSVDAIAQRHAIERYIRDGHAKRVRDLTKALLTLPIQKAAKIDDALLGVIEHGVLGGRIIAARYAPDKMKDDAHSVLYETKKAERKSPSIGERGAKWARKHAADMVVEISNGQRKAIRRAVAIGQKSGLHPRTVAKMIRRVIGLDEMRGAAVAKFEAKLIEQGKSEDDAASMAESYHQRLVRSRADTIARTEMSRSMNEGRTSLWRDIVDEDIIPEGAIRRRWFSVRDVDVDDICEGLDDEVVGLNENFSGGYHAPPDPHPNCRCDILIEVD